MADITLHQVTDANSYSSYKNFGRTDYQKSATAFYVALSGVKLTKIQARISGPASPPDAVRCKVYSNDSTNEEPDELLATSTNTVTPDDDLSTYETWNFDGTLEFEAGKIYWAVFERTGSLDNSNYYSHARGTANGVRYQSEEWKYYDGSSWQVYSSGYIGYTKVFGQRGATEEILNYNYEYDTYQNFATSTTYWGIAQKFKTPTNVDDNTYLIDEIACGFGGWSPYGCTSGDCDIYCEIHKGSATSLDLGDSSTTRVGGRSNGVDRALKGTSYYVTEVLHWTWDANDRPELDPDTEYWIVFVPKTVNDSGGWRVGQDNTDPKGDGYSQYRLNNTGVLISTGAGEVWTNLYVLATQRAIVNEDIIIPWTIVDVDIHTVDSDIILSWLLSDYLENDLILRWNIKEDWELTLRWDLRTDLTRDSILKWKILNEAQYDFLLRWGLLVEADFTLPWVLRPLITHDFILPIPIRMDTDFILRWGFNYQVTNDAIFRWIIDSRVWRDVALKYHIKVETDHILLIPLRAQVDKDVIIKSHLTSDIVADNVLRFNIREFNQVDADNKLRWVLEGRPRFYKITFT